MPGFRHDDHFFPGIVDSPFPSYSGPEKNSTPPLVQGSAALGCLSQLINSKEGMFGLVIKASCLVAIT
jgi:hypothetical protein